jgi:uncharacterized protein YicC (UPF0701 family)
MAPQSMTGYGRGLSGNMKVEVRSFNHKNLDIHVSMPSYLYRYDVPIKKSIRGTLHRGRKSASMKNWQRNIIRPFLT